MDHVEPRNIAPERSKWRRLAQARGNTCSCSAHDVMFSTFPKESGLDLKIIGNHRKFNWCSLNPSTLLKIFYSILLQFKNARFISILNLVCQRSNWSRAWISQCAKTTKDNGAGRICPSPGCAKSSGKRSCSRTWWVKQELIDGLQVIASSWSMSEKVGLAPKANTCSLWALSIPHSSYLEYFGIHEYPCQHTASVLAKWVKLRTYPPQADVASPLQRLPHGNSHILTRWLRGFSVPSCPAEASQAQAAALPWHDCLVELRRSDVTPKYPKYTEMSQT